MRSISLCVVAFAAASCESRPDPAAASLPALRVGTWVRFGPKSVIGHGTDHLLRVERSGDAWRIERTTVEIPRIGRGEPVQVWSVVLEPVSADGTSLDFEGDRGPVRITYRYDGDRWVVPALVPCGPHAWVVRQGDQRESRWECLVDPTVNERGPARFPTPRPAALAERYPQTFEVRRAPQGRYVRSLVFSEADSSGVSECAELSWDRDGVLYFEGSSWFRSRQTWYEPLDAEEPAHQRLLERVASARRIEPPPGMPLRRLW